VSAAVLANVASPTGSVEPVWEVVPEGHVVTRGAGMPRQLGRRYGGELLVPLRTDRPTVVANFVTTLDGIVAFGGGSLSGGGLISGFYEPDRFLMALLRAMADVVLVGAGTLRRSTASRWVAAHLQPQLADLFVEWRTTMGIRPNPTTVFVTASGDIPPRHPALCDEAIPVVIATTVVGAARLRGLGLPEHVEVQAVDSPTGADLQGLLANLDARLVLSEGGPHLLGQLLASDVLDELFLTIAPQLGGRAAPDRLALVEGIAFPPDAARWLRLRSVRVSGDHLFLRYGRSAGQRDQQEARHA
jgi:riboflavin biosynthesis pyrimidine reductase